MLVTDSFGRAWRHGQVDVAIGVAGMQPLDDWRGRSDSAGMQLRATWLAVADAAAALGELARAKDSREPVVIVDGLARYVTADDGPGVGGCCARSMRTCSAESVPAIVASWLARPIRAMWVGSGNAAADSHRIYGTEGEAGTLGRR